MLFSSVTFLFYFLPVLLALYFPFRRNIKVANIILLCGSLVFYAWGEPTFILIMLLSILMNYTVGRLIDRFRTHDRFFLGLGVALNLSLLVYWKYIGFIIANISTFSPFTLPVPTISLPLGISFFTFQAITYLVDLKRQEIPVQRNPFYVALYISLFPQLIAGPIVRYHDIAKQITDRQVTLGDFTYGVRRFIIGFSKKILLANTFGLVADEIYALPTEDYTTYLVLFAMFAYTFQIYFDFSAYSDMAIGLGRMFGFHFLENFNYPYISGSIREFWRRWHISLSTFLRDYLYIPLGGSRAGPYKTYRNLIIVFFLCGLWHGAGWTFVLWGLYFGFFLILERLFLGKVLDKIHPLIAWAYMMVVVMFSWLLFRAETIDQFLAMLGALFEGAKTGAYKKYAEDSFLQVTLVLACIGATPLFRDKVLEAKRHWVRVFCDIFLFGIFLVSVAYLAAGTYNPFIYFRF